MDPEKLKPLHKYFEKDLLSAIEQEGIYVQLQKGERLLSPGAIIPGIPLIVEGRIKVMREGKEKDMLLYYLQAGESCIMSLAGCMHQKASEVAAIAEVDSTLVILPAHLLRPWMRKYSTLTNFLMDLYEKRYLDLLETIDQFVFFNLEDRLIHYLDQQVSLTQSSHLELTHQEIAGDLGTSREVISRLLKRLQTVGKIDLSHKSIKVLSPGKGQRA